MKFKFIYRLATPVIRWFIGSRRECKQAEEDGDCLCIVLVNIARAYNNSFRDYDTEHNYNNHCCYDYVYYYTGIGVDDAVK